MHMNEIIKPSSKSLRLPVDIQQHIRIYLVNYRIFESYYPLNTPFSKNAFSVRMKCLLEPILHMRFISRPYGINEVFN